MFRCRGRHGCSSFLGRRPQLDGSGVQFHRSLHERGLLRYVDIFGAALVAGLNEGNTVRQEQPGGLKDHAGVAAHRSELRSVSGGGNDRLGIGSPRRRGVCQDRSRTGGGGSRRRGCK